MTTTIYAAALITSTGRTLGHHTVKTSAKTAAGTIRAIRRAIGTPNALLCGEKVVAVQGSGDNGRFTLPV